MFYRIFLGFLFILCLIINCFGQEDNSTGISTILTSTLITAATTTTNLEINKTSVLLCPGGHIDAPNCTVCALNSDNKDGKCLEKKNELKASRSLGRRIFLILFACLLTILLIISMFIVYGRLNQQHRHRSSTNQGNNSQISNRFNNILQSIGLNNLNKRGRFPFFSISNNNNNNSSNQYRQQESSSRVPLSENPDEALLFDDPYADGGFNNSSVNPYRSLTLSVT